MKKTLLHVFLYLLFLIPSKTFAAPDMPSVSSGATEYWYQIVFQRNNAELVLQDNGDDAILTVQIPSTTDATKQLWKIEAGATSGKYILTSKGGRKLYWDGTSRFKASPTATATELTLVTSTNTTFTDSYELQRNGGTLGMNPSGGSTAGNQMGETTMADGGNCLRFVPQGLASQVRLSAGATEYWYNVEFINNGNVWLKDNGEDAIAKTDYLTIGADNMLWKMETGSTAGYFKITSKAGRKLYWDGTSRFKASTSATATDITFITNGVVWEIQRTGATNTLNPAGGPTVDKEIGEYTKGDGGSRCRFAFSPFKVSDATNTYWYRIADNRGTSNYWHTSTYSGNTNTVMFTSTLPANTAAGYFKFVKNTTGNGYLIYGATQPTIPIARKDNRIQADGTAGEPMYITPSPVYTQSRYIIKRESNGMQYNSFGDGSNRVWEYNSDTDDGNRWKFLEIPTATIKTDYTTLRTNARRLYNYSAAGSYFGKFPAADRATFLAVIEAEEAKNADNLTTQQHLDGYNALFNAIATYKSKVISDVSTITSTAASPKWFYISNNATNSGASYAFAKVMTSNGVTATGQNFKFETKAGTDAQYWRFEAVTSGVRIINKAASGYEFGDPTAIAAGSGHTYIPAIYTNDVVASITLAKSGQNPLHAQSASSVIVKWGADVGNASLWVLQAKDENLTNGTAVVPVVSTVANPVYYYIFSAADGRVNRAGSPDATTPYDFRAYALISPAADGFLKWGVPAGDNALWAIVDVGSGVKKLYNKGTGKYMTGSHSQNGTGEPLTYTPFASPNDLQYEIKSGTNSFVVPYNLNTANRNSTLGVFSQTAWYFVAPTYTGTGDISTTNNWSNASVPASQVAVIIDGDATVNADANYNNITINSGKSLSVAPGKGLTINGTLLNNGTFTLKSDATSGTATVTGNVSGNATVEQYLPAGTERTWWYLASPVTGAAWTVFGSNQVGEYSETSRSYSAPFTATETLTAGKGYVVKMNAAQAANVYQFANKALNNGNISVALTRSVTGALDNKRGFNLVGNPYPSYLNWELAYNASTNIRSTIWYRTKGASAMEFHTYNAALGVSVPTSASGYIPPMQAFWVKVDTDPVSPATVSNGTLNFTNAMRGHAIQGTTTPLKAPATNSLPLLRIALSNGSTSDETVIALHENASANFDQYDSEKMSNTGTSEVFTLAGTQELTINALPDSEGSKLIPLGIRPANAGSLNLSVSELKNLDNMQIILHDNVLKTETQLSLNESYNFISDGTATNNRFSIEFRAPGMTTGFDNNNSEDFNITVYSGKIQIQSPAMANGELIRVYSSNGQKIIEQTAKGNNTIIDHKLSSGVYFVKVSNYVQKIIIH